MPWGVGSYSTTPSANPNINGINLQYGCNASGINIAIQQMMADIASYVAGNVGPITAITANTTVAAANAGTKYIATTALVLSLPLSTTLTNTFSFSIMSVAGVTVTPVSAGDAIQGGAAGASATIPAGVGGVISTDGAGNWWFTGDTAAVPAAAAAQSTANSAITNAATAQSTANTAVTNAATAQSAASTAASYAPTTVASGWQAITNGGAYSFSHGLTAVPTDVFLEMQCQTAELGYSIGDVVQVTAGPIPTQGYGNTIWKNATQAGVSNSSATAVTYKSSASVGNITPANWKQRLVCVLNGR